MQPLTLIAVAWLVGVAILVVVLRAYFARRRIQGRLFPAEEVDVDEMVRDERGGFLGRRLFLAGFRAPGAVSLFVTLTLVLACCSALMVWSVYRAGAVDRLAELFSGFPGGIGEVFLPLVILSPWIGALMLTGMPALVVRAGRLKRVRTVEQDLPLTLDLLATLAQAGLGFDIALDRILATQPADRPLVREFRSFQFDLLGGRTRIEALRRLARRIEVGWFSIFISAVVQAEQLGASIAETLATQAQDLRERRRERAMAFASAVPVKLLFPLIICFLPGVMAAALGPTMFQIVQTIDGFLAPMATPAQQSFTLPNVRRLPAAPKPTATRPEP